MSPDAIRWLRAFVPAVLVFGLGWLIHLRPLSGEVSLLQQRVENMGPISAKEDAVRLAEAQLDAVRASAREKSAAAGKGMAAFDSGTAARELSALCLRHRLSLDSAAADKGAQLPAALKNASSSLTGSGQVWRVELTGAYPDMQAMLNALGQTVPLIVPLSISMTAAEMEGAPPHWTLLVWL